MSVLWLLGGFPGLVLGLWASLTPWPNKRLGLLASFGFGGLIGGTGGFIAVTLLVWQLQDIQAAVWFLMLLSWAFYAFLGAVLSRPLLWLLRKINATWQKHHRLYAAVLGLLIGLMTGLMFGMVTIGTGPLEELFGRWTS
jgi:hypothetical protein